MCKKIIVLLVLVLLLHNIYGDRYFRPDPPTNDEMEIDHNRTPTSGFVMRKSKTIDERNAMRLVRKILKMIDKKGFEKVRDLINLQDESTKENKLYVFILDLEGNVIAHGGNPALSGKNLKKLQDDKGNYFIEKFIRAMKKYDTAFLQYRWKNYDSGKFSNKNTFLKRINQNLFIGCGVYNTY